MARTRQTREVHCVDSCHAMKVTATRCCGNEITIGGQSYAHKTQRTGAALVWTAPCIWCCRTGLNCRPLPSSRYRFRGPLGLRAGPSLHHRPKARRCRPSGLYTFPARPGLARDWHGPRWPLAFPDFGRFAPGRFRPGRQVILPRECSTTELRQRISFISLPQTLP